MRKNIWILHPHASAPSKGALVRPYDLSKCLTKKGYDPIIFTSNYNHFTHEVTDTQNERYTKSNQDGVDFIFVKVTQYPNNGIKRILSMFSYLINVKRVIRKCIKTHVKPDVIYASSPHPLALIAGIQIAKKLHIPCVVEIRDLWPESIAEYSTRFTKKHPLIKLLYKGEKWIYKKADGIIFTQPGGADYIREQGWDKDIDMSKVHHINNGVDLEAFDYNRDNFRIQDDDLESPDIFKVVYTGSIRRVNNIGILLDAAKLIDNPKIKFLIWGDGDELEMLNQRILSEGITNVCFKGRVEKKYVPYILSRADVNVLHCEYMPLLRYGISHNKSFEYLACAKPILSTINPNYDYISLNNAGISLENQFPHNIANAVLQLCEMEDQKYNEMCQDARKLAKQYDFGVLTDKLIDIVEGL